MGIKVTIPSRPGYRAPYDPGIDIVMAAIYGAIPVTDIKLLATAALLRSQWADPGSTYLRPIPAHLVAPGLRRRGVRERQTRRTTRRIRR